MLFVLAIITYATRTYIRARVLKQVAAEDFILLFAVIGLCAVTGLAYASMQNQYDALQVILGSGEVGLLLQVLGDIPKVAKEENAASTLWFIVIFSVKMAFLFFFRRLISRLRGAHIYWWCVLIFMSLAGLVSIAVAWLTCPYSTTQKVLCESVPSILCLHLLTSSSVLRALGQL